MSTAAASPRRATGARRQRNAFAQAMFDAKAAGHYVPDVELVWIDKVDIAAGCHLASALLFAFETH